MYLLVSCVCVRLLVCKDQWPTAGIVIMLLCVAACSPTVADGEDELMSKPTADKSEEMLPMLANGVPPSLILPPSVTGDTRLTDDDVAQPPGISCTVTQTPLTNGVCNIDLNSRGTRDQTKQNQLVRLIIHSQLY